ncbi:MAG: class I SAM-dependent methyltransferase [Actinomycetota bacterium]|nr:class I SAM-dependent methyltransferase [Actinomycetota bacterium]
MTIGARFARVATGLVVRRPALWRLFRAPMRRQFERLAPRWDDLRSADHLASFEAALDLLPGTPRRVLDLGTGTGAAALAMASRWPESELVGVDVSEAMLAAARGKLAPPFAGRVSFVAADAAALPFEDASFDLVTLANMIPFFDELARVLAPGGHMVFASSVGPQTPIYVPPERLRAELEQRGFAGFRELSAGSGTAFLARKAEPR